MLQPVVVGKAAHRGSRQKVFKERQKAARPCQKKEGFPREMQAGRQQKMLGKVTSLGSHQKDRDLE